MFAIFRTKGNSTQDISFDCEAFEYYTSKKIAENIAENIVDELIEIWSQRDGIRHPWYESKFHVENVSEDYIRRKNEAYSIIMANIEMAM